MPLHLVKLSAGAATVDDLRARVDASVAHNIQLERGRVHECLTRMRPKRIDELLDGGSLYWVIAGNVLARQRIVSLETREGRDQITRIGIMLDPTIVLTEAQPRRAFQGWRYLSADDAPADVAAGASHSVPPALRAALADLGLL